MIKPDIPYTSTPPNELRSEVKVSRKSTEVDKYVVRMLRGITREKSLDNVPVSAVLTLTDRETKSSLWLRGHWRD